MSPLPYCLCAIVLVVVGAFNNAGATTFIPAANRDFQMIINSLRDVAKAIANCQSTDAVLKVAEILRSQQTTLNQPMSSTVHQSPQQCQPLSNELAIQFGEYKNKFEVAEQQIKQLEERLLQVETTSSQAREKSQNNGGKLQALEKKVDQATSKNSCRSPFYQVDDDCIYIDSALTFSWHRCREFCRALGGDLAVPSDVLKLRQFLISVPTEWNYWIGGSDLKTEGNWLWLDGRQVDRSVGWLNGQPSNAGGNEHCLHYWAEESLLLNDAPCTEELRCVCQDASYPM